MALLTTGEVFAWGDRENGVCGVGEVNDHQYLPRLVWSLKGAQLWLVEIDLLID